ncbi:MAG: LamG domain-containing protein [Pirellulaceae bacterium]
MIKNAISLAFGLAIIIAPGWTHADLVGEWLFSGNANDTSGNGQHGSIFGATSATDRFGNPSAAYDFSPSNSSYIDLPSGFLPVGAGPISYSLWVNPRNNSGLDHRLIHHGGFAAGQGFNLYINENAYRLDYFGTQYFDFDDTVQGQWQHLALVHDGIGHTFYLNGVETSSSNKALAIVAGNPMTLGRYPGGGFHYDGLMDDVRVYNHALSASEVQQLAGIPEPSAWVFLVVVAVALLTCQSRRNRGMLRL